MSEEITPLSRNKNDTTGTEIEEDTESVQSSDDNDKSEDLTELQKEPDARIRYFAVGPKIREIKCPVCFRKSLTFEDTAFNTKDQIHSCLSCFSCCFPVFFASFLILIFSRFTRRQRNFCVNCGAHVGFHFRPA